MIQNGEKYMFEHYYIYPDDVWVDGDPEKGFTSEIERVISTFGGRKDFDSRDIEDVRYLLVDLAFEMHGSDEYASNYWDYLSQYGISTSTDGVA